MNTTDQRRRDFLRQAMTAAGFATLSGSGVLLTACDPDRRRASSPSMFSDEQVSWLDEVAETILPTTNTPGAKAAEVGAFIALMVTDTYSPDEQGQFQAGMESLEAECSADHGHGFLAASPAQREDLLNRLDREAHDYMTDRAADAPVHYFRMIKELTVLGYFTSEIGYTQAMRYVETPGRFDPCLDYSPGEKFWARHA